MKLFKIILISLTLLCFTFSKCYGRRILISDDEDISEGSGFRDIEKNHTYSPEEITTTTTTIKTTEESIITSTLSSNSDEIYEDSIETSNIKNNDKELELYDLDDFEFLDNFFENITTENTDDNEQNEYKNNDLIVYTCSSVEENSNENIGCLNATIETTTVTTEGNIITSTLSSNLDEIDEDSTSSIENNDKDLEFYYYENTNETIENEIIKDIVNSTTKINLELTMFAFVLLILLISMKFCYF